MVAQGFVILSADDADVPDLPGVCTVSRTEAWDDGGFAIGQAAAERGSLWCDRPYFTGNPEPDWLAERCRTPLDAGAFVQVGNELNLDLEGFQGGPAAYFALEDEVRSRLGPDADDVLLAMPPSPGVPGWEEWVRPAGHHAVHAYGTFDQMKQIVNWYLANTEGSLFVTECNFGAGNQVDLDAWTQAHLRPFLDWCAALPRVRMAAYFAWRWTGAPPMPTPVDGAGTAVESLLTSWVPPMNGGSTEWYPNAVERPISRNYTPGRSASPMAAIVCHIADGLGSPFGWFDQDRGDDGSSAHFWISKAGLVEQYRPLSDTCWANGPICDPDLENPAVLRIVTTGVDPNAVTVAIEHEGYPGDDFPDVQVAASRELVAWLAGVYGLAVSEDTVIEHAQFDHCTRANCPGPSFPWEEILGEEEPEEPAYDVDAARDRLWVEADALEQAGWPWFGQGIKALVSLSKAEQ